MPAPPLFSLVTVVSERPRPDHLAALVHSVTSQSDPDWELLVVGGPEAATAVDQAISLGGDGRITVIRRDTADGPTVSANHGLDAATGTFVAIVDHDATLAPFALASCRAVADTWADADVIYADEDTLGPDGGRGDTFCKPQFSPEWLRCHPYLGPFTLYRRSLVDDVGAFRPAFDGAHDHDLALRATELARRVVHIPRVLYHGRRAEAADGAATHDDARVRAVQASLDRQGIPAVAQRHADTPGIVHIEPALGDQPLVSIIVLTAGGSRLVTGERRRLVDHCLTSIAARRTYGNVEVVVVVDGDAPSELEEELSACGLPDVTFVRNHRPFNFSEACNLGRDHASGEVLVFLNDDTEVITANWLERLVLFSSIDGVGAVGVKLLYSDGTIQHVGFVSRSHLHHRALGVAGDDPGPENRFVAQTNVFGVTAACLAIRSDRFDAVGGFTRRFPLAYNDVDLCLKLYRAGYRTVLDPAVVLTHHEASSRDPSISDAETELLFERWRYLVEDDPYDSPHLRYDGLADAAQVQPPASFMVLKELVGRDQAPPRPWPPDDMFSAPVA